MKKLLTILLVAAILMGCSEPTISTARKAAEKYIKSTKPSAEVTVYESPDTNTILVEFRYTGYFLSKSLVSQAEIDWWDNMVNTISAVNVETKIKIDEAGHPANCTFYVIDATNPYIEMLRVENGVVVNNYLAGAKDTYMTLAKYNQIKNGMSYAEVCEIVGRDGILISAVDLELGAQYKTEMYAWYAADGIANANVMIQGGRVISKAQLGLT